MVTFRITPARRSSSLRTLMMGMLSVAMLVSLSSGAAGAREPAPGTALSTAKQLVAAFNQHDADAMALLVTEDFQLYYVDEEGKAELAIQGPEQLAADMKAYFATRPSVRSTITGAIDGPRFVSFREQIAGGDSSLAVYEIHNQRVRRAWYYPAEKNSQPHG